MFTFSPGGTVFSKQADLPTRTKKKKKKKQVLLETEKKARQKRKDYHQLGPTESPIFKKLRLFEMIDTNEQGRGGRGKSLWLPLGEEA